MRSLLFASGVLLLLGACSAFEIKDIKPPQPGDTEGLIFVDSPEVFARERLIRDRERQKKWLQDQLDLPAEAFDAFQAVVQSQRLDRSSFSLGIDATPATGLAIRQADAQAEQLSRGQEIADLEHQIRLAQLQKDLERVQAGEQPLASGTANSTAGGGNTTNGGTGGGNTGSGTGGAAAGGDPNAAASPATPQSPAATSPSLPAFNPAAVTAKDTPIDRFRDRLAYREIVRQELLENDLDDAHDLLGNTLYRWTFDTTIIPENNTSHWGFVNIEIGANSKCDHEDPKQIPVLIELLKGFKSALISFLSLEVKSLAHAYFIEDLDTVEPEIALLVLKNDSDRERNRLTAMQKAESNLSSLEAQQRELTTRIESAKDTKARASLQAEADKIQSDISNAKKDILEIRNNAEQEAARVLAGEYREILEAQNLDTHLTVRKVPNRPEVNVDYSGDEKKDELASFCQLFNNRSGRIEPYAVTPKESIERIADTATARSEKERAVTLALAAGIVATFNKVQQPPGWKATPPFNMLGTWVWTSEGNAPVGDVRLHKPKSTPKTTPAMFHFSVESETDVVTADKENKGVVGLIFKFEKKKDPSGQTTNIVDKVFLEIEGAVPDAEGSQTACLSTTAYPWEISDTCRIELHLQSLTVGKVVTIKVSRKEAGKTIAHDPIGLEIRRN